MSEDTRLELPSGLHLPDPIGRLRRFCGEEYPYYDAVASADPDRVDPVDVVVTVAMNSFVNNATAVRAVHRGVAAACDPVLATIPESADLRSFDLGVVEGLLDAACRVRGVLVPVATKVLHRKRRRLIPMLDSVVIDAYREAGLTVAGAALQDGHRAAAAVMPVMEAFRDDLRAAWDPLTGVARTLTGDGWILTELRMLEILIWIEREPRGYYRKG